MRKPASASADVEKTRLAMGQDTAHGIAHDLATETVCLALLLALVALVCRIASIW
jgi:predicted DNA-binding helix-hairpin-helix protein